MDLDTGTHRQADVLAVESFNDNREEETLVLLTKGYSNKEIAGHLSLSIETVRSHLKSIYTKMHVRSRAEAVAH